MCRKPPAATDALSPERLAAAGDTCQKHVRLATWVCNKFLRYKFDQRPGFAEYDDYRSAAFEGLWVASRKFDPARRTSFATYACRVMWNRMDQHYQAQRKRYRSTNRHQPAWDLLLGDPPADGRMERADAGLVAARVAARLNARELEIMRARAAGSSNGEIAAVYGLSRERVRQIIDRVRERLAPLLDLPEVAAQVEEGGRPAERRMYRPRHRYGPGDNGADDEQDDNDNPWRHFALRCWEDGER